MILLKFYIRSICKIPKEDTEVNYDRAIDSIIIINNLGIDCIRFNMI